MNSMSCSISTQNFRLSCVHISVESDVMCWGKNGIALRSCGNEDVIGVCAWIVSNPMQPRVSAKLPKVFGRFSDGFDYQVFSPIRVFGWFRCDIGSIACRSVWEFSKGIVIRLGKIGQ